jgi:hypothetical protein
MRQANKRLLVSCLAYSSALNMEITHSSELEINFQCTARCHILDGTAPDNHCCETFKTYSQTKEQHKNETSQDNVMQMKK